MRLDDHPTVLKVRASAASKEPDEPLNATWLKELCRKAGADDVGLVSIDRPEIADQKSDILSILP